MGQHHGLQAVGEANTTSVDWRAGLPDLTGQQVTLRELRRSDAPSLHAEMNAPEVKRFMWSPPPSAQAFEKFVEWAHAERATGRYICYGVVPQGHAHAVGVFELRQLQPGFFRGEFGFVLPPWCWGRGIFLEGAHMLLDFAVDVVNVHRIEARASIDNDRGNAALRKLGGAPRGHAERCVRPGRTAGRSVFVGDSRARLARDADRSSALDRQVLPDFPVLRFANGLAFESQAFRQRVDRVPHISKALTVRQVPRVQIGEFRAGARHLMEMQERRQRHLQRPRESRGVQNGNVAQAPFDA
jgi:ribosomal-protein-alanine N-acetyltransferase